jgi:TRAP transporter TAXI family solute receptor
MPNPRIPTVLAVDFGTSSTVCALRSPDGVTRPLLFDGSPIMPSVVYLDDQGVFHVGRDARIMARIDPSRFEPHPKRHVGEGTVLLGGDEVPVAALLTAIFQTVRVQVEAVLGAMPERCVLTHPAKWGPASRQTLVEAARDAGLTPDALVVEPVAGGAYFSQGTRIDPERPVAVYDLGAGTFDVAVLSPDSAGRTVIAQGGHPDLGGADIDQELFTHLGKQIAADHPDAWERLRDPADAPALRERQAVWEAVREAKEMLSRASNAPLAVPGVEHGTHLTRGELDRLAEPIIDRTVAITAEVIERSGYAPTDLGGLFLTGGASRMPLVARLLHTRLGMVPTLIEQPELPVAFGALAAAETETATPRPSGTPAPTPATAPATATGPIPSQTTLLPPHPDRPRPVLRRALWVTLVLVLALTVPAAVASQLDWDPERGTISTTGTDPETPTPNQAPTTAPPIQTRVFDEVELSSGYLWAYNNSFATALTDMWAEHLDGFTVVEQDPGPAFYTAEQFLQSGATMGVAHSSSMPAAFESTGVDPTDYAVLGNVLPFGTLTVTVRADSGIERFEDLDGKNVVSCYSNYEINATCEYSQDIFDYLGIEPALALEPTSTDAQAMFRDGEVDAVIEGLTMPSLFNTYYRNSADIRILGVPEPMLTQFSADFSVIEVAADDKYFPNGFTTVTNWLTLYVDRAMDEQQAYDLVKALYENLDQVDNPLARYASADYALDAYDGLVPIHPGAERYYREIGLL